MQGEEYKLFWPEQPEFVRVASKFGAKIVPFGVVGEDDICHVRIFLDVLAKEALMSLSLSLCLCSTKLYFDLVWYNG